MRNATLIRSGLYGVIGLGITAGLASCGGSFSSPTSTSFRTFDGAKNQIYVTVGYEVDGENTTQAAMDTLVKSSNARILADAQARSGSIQASTADMEALKQELKYGLQKSLDSATQNDPSFKAGNISVSVVDLIKQCNENLALYPGVPEGVGCASDSDDPGQPGYLRATVQWKDEARSKDYPFDVFTYLDVDMVTAGATPYTHAAKTAKQTAAIQQYDQSQIVPQVFTGQPVIPHTIPPQTQQ